MVLATMPLSVRAATNQCRLSPTVVSVIIVHTVYGANTLTSYLETELSYVIL